MNEPYTTTEFTTGTSSIVVFDPSALVHRSVDVADWWTVPSDELKEINNGNVLFVDLGEDGTYDVDIFQNIKESNCKSKYFSAFIKVQSGCIYIGAGEQVTAEGFGPETTYGGALVYAECGTCELRIYNPKSGKLIVEYENSKNKAENNFEQSLKF